MTYSSFETAIHSAAARPAFRRASGFTTVLVFSLLSLASSRPKAHQESAAPASSGEKTSAETPKATLIGSCDRSAHSVPTCNEVYAPDTFEAESKKCEADGARFRVGPCPRLRALSQCFEGTEPYLFGSYTYQGNKSKPKADRCSRGYRDLEATPELKVSSSPASCNAIATGGTCMEFSAVTVDAEKHCLLSGGTMKQPSEPCPRTNGLTMIHTKVGDGTAVAQYFYATPYDDGRGKKTQTVDEVALICALAGCKLEAFPSASAAPGKAVAGKSAASAPKKSGSKSGAKK